MRILITGGSGFIGTNLVEFYKDNYSVVNADIVKPRNMDHDKYWKQIDILKFDELYDFCSNFRPEFIVHMAARTDLDGKSIEAYEANIAGSKKHHRSCREITKRKEKYICFPLGLYVKLATTPKMNMIIGPQTFYGKRKNGWVKKILRKV